MKKSTQKKVALLDVEDSSEGEMPLEMLQQALSKVKKAPRKAI